MQDTVSTQGIEFTPVPQETPVAKPATVSKTKKKPAAAKPARQESKTLGAIFIAGFLGGLAAFMMPCIYPMLPLTVSYFSKKTQTRAGAVRTAIIYGLSIIGIYVVLGLAVTIIFGPSTLNNLSTNGIFNFAIFLLLVVFAASFLGAFEITLPNSWVNKMDQQSDKSGFAGIFFMAATLALVSFSCTGPIIGTLLVQAAVSGALLSPAIGMLGYSLALAIPFTLFAMFPGLLQSMPKSGGWLNSVKVTLGFLELALSFKFLSNVDLAYHWKLFDREIFLVLWIVIFALMGFYLLGKLRLSHDSEVSHIAVPRLFLAIGVLSFTLYLVPGLWGAPLKAVSALLPPQSTQDFDLYTPTLNGNRSIGENPTTQTFTRKYTDLFEDPAGQKPFFDYAEGMAYAKKVNKPVLIDFTGHACVNCRKMEANVWTDNTILPVIRDKYVLIQLYVDDKKDLPKAEQYVSKLNGKQITTIGDLNSDLQASKYNSNSQPFYVLLDANTDTLLTEPRGAEYDPPVYLDFLQTGFTAYSKHR
jgi:thiol:disulfide interchange protein